MGVVLIIGMWLLLGSMLCLASGRGIAIGQNADVDPQDDAPRFARLAVHEWALAAHDVAIAELLTTRPGAIRRVAAK